MRRSLIAVATLVLLLGGEGRARSQMATFDAAALSQAILSFIQDGDNMASSTAQFLENLGVMQEQLEYLRGLSERYSTVRSAIYRCQEVVRIAQYYEMTSRLFAQYVSTLRSLDEQTLGYSQVRTLLNQAFQYLVIASREVKRARDYLDSSSQLDEGQRREGLSRCERTLSRTNAALYGRMLRTYSSLDSGRILGRNLDYLEESFRVEY